MGSNRCFQVANPVQPEGGGARLLFGLFLFVALILMPASQALALSPSVETTPASGVGETTATLNGDANPNGLETKTYFEYGTTTSYGSKTAEVNIGSGTSVVAKSVSLNSLKANTLYHYRIVASNASGTSQGADLTFTTVGPPEAATWSATPESGGEAATLKAWIDPNGQSTTYQFEYGIASGSYTTTVPIPAASAGSEYSGHFVTYKITGLMPGTKYYYRVSAENKGGKVLGNEVSFLGSNVPGLVTLPASELSRSEAVFSATIEPHKLATKYYFEYGTTTAYGTKIPLTPKEVSSEVEVSTVSEAVSGLTANTLYHYRVKAENSAGVSYGTDQTFTSLAPVTLRAEGAQVKLGATLNAFSSNFSLDGETCNETNLSGPLEENPGALQVVNTTIIQNNGERCPFSTAMAAYSVPAGMTLEYAVNSAGEGVMRSSKFTLVAVFYEAPWVLECNYKLQLTGTYEMGSALVATLSGKGEYISGGPGCPPLGIASGTFGVTSGGVAVEAS